MAGVTRLYCLLFFAFFLSVQALASPAPRTFIKKTDGVVVYPDPALAGGTRCIFFQVINDRIIRVVASPDTALAPVKSLITVYESTSRNWTLSTAAGQVIIKTAALTANIALGTGAVVFSDNTGKLLLKEKQSGGRVFTPAVFEGQPSNGISQVFETTNDDSYYGLGQHQSDQFNYRGDQVFLFQNNTEVAIPFLVSRKNYGILWDNYSLTKVGDTRNFMPLSALKLFSKTDAPGWLTASYSNDRRKPETVAFLKAESEINYPFLGDSKKLPADFKIQSGVITWEGAMSSGFTGQHKFLFSYAGYIKFWVDGKLQLERWRQAWNPGSGVVKLDLEKDKKYKVKIEWIPDGSESYLSVKWLDPVAKSAMNDIGFTSEAGKNSDYYLIAGQNIDQVISGYRTLTGKATIVPKWAMGFWQSRERYKTQSELLETVAEFRKRKIPLDNIVLDWSYWKQNDWGSQEFDATRFASPDSMISAVHKQNAHFMISAWPKFYEGVKAYDEFKAKGWIYPRNVADSQRDWIAQGYVSSFYDAFNDQAKKGFWDLLNNKLYKKGVDAWWMDASEPDILSNVSPEKRKLQMTPLSAGLAAEYLNAYPLENAKGIYHGQRSVDPDKRVFLLTRSGFAGSQHYAASIWSGDIASRWEDMKAQISAGLNFSLSGLPFWTMDIGGFSVERRYENAKGADLDEWRELQARWFQFGAFVPLFRAHGQFPFREVYNIAPEEHPAYKSMLSYNKLRYRLMPYIYSLAGMTYHNDYTIMRGLVMDFPNDKAVNNIGDQFMFGPSILVNPVYTYQARERKLYLPAGQGWYNFYTGRYSAGGVYQTVPAAYDTMPLYVKEGSIIPTGPDLQYTNEKPADTISLLVYTGKDARFSLYEDEDTNYQYEKGKFSNIGFTYSEAKHELTIEERNGSFEKMLTQRFFKVIVIDRRGSRSMETLKYSGQKITLKI